MGVATQLSDRQGVRLRAREGVEPAAGYCSVRNDVGVPSGPILLLIRLLR